MCGQGRASAHACDIRDEEQVAATVADIVKAHGRIDGLVNNAGGQFPAPLADISQKGWETVVRTNLTGGFLMARECYTQWMRDNGGAIVNIVADMWTSMSGMGHSGAARAGMVNLTRRRRRNGAPAACASTRWRPAGSPRPVSIPIPTASSPCCGRFPATRPCSAMGTEAEVSAAIVFLLSPAAAFISGDTLRVDGAAPNARRHVELPAHDRSKPWNGFHRSKPPDLLREE